MREQNLFQKIKEGDERAFDTLFHQQYPKLVRLSYKLVAQIDAAEDIAQKVFIQLWDKKSGININTTIDAYLSKAIIFKSIDYIRKNKRDQEKQKTYNTDFFQLNAASPEHILLEKESLAFIYSKIETLPAKTKVVFKLSRFEDMTYEKIAKQLDISIKTVEYHISTALRLLRKALFLVVLSFFLFLF